MTGTSDAILDPARLDVLRRTKLLDTRSEESLDQLSRVAARLLQAPLALISLVDENRQYFKSCVGGLPEPWHRAQETPLSYSICQYAVASAQPFVVGDTRNNPITSSNRAVTELGVAAYAGIPLIIEDQAIGTLCVVDSKPREWTDEQVDTLKSLADAVASALSFRTAAQQAPSTEGEASPSETEHQNHLAGNLLASATRYIDALDAYDLCLEQDADGGFLETEASLRDKIATAEAQLAADVSAARSEFTFTAAEDNATVGAATDLLEACEAYLGALRKRHDLSTAFQRSEVGLEDVERQALLAREAEQALRFAQRSYTLKLD